MQGAFWRWGRILLPLGFLAVAFAWPLFSVMRVGLGWDGQGILAPFIDAASDPYLRGRFVFTVWQAALSTILALLFGLPSAYVFAKYRFRGRGVLLAAITIPFILPPIVVALGLLSLLGPSGLANDALKGLFGFDEPPIRLLNTFAIILIAHVVYEYTIVVRLVSTFWSNMDPAMGEAASMLGASPRRVFLTVTAPLLAPAIAAAAALIFLFTFTSFGIILILGAPEHATLEVEIYSLMTKLFRPQLAAALALTQLIATFGMLWAYVRLQSAAVSRIRLRAQGIAATASTRSPMDYMMLIGAFAAVFLVLSPPLALLVRSFITPDGLGLDGYAAIMSNDRNEYFYISPIGAIRNSLGFAFVTVVLAVPLGVLAAYGLRNPRAWWRNPLDALYMLPLGVSAVTLGLGYLLSLRVGEFDVRTTVVPIILAHTLIAYPFVIRVVLSTMRAIRPHLREAAHVLGTGPLMTVMRVDLPILSRAILVGSVFAFAVSLGEFGATLLLSRPEYTTMPVAILNYLTRPGAANLASALAMSTVLMVVAGAGFFLIERARYRGWGEF